MKVGPLLQARFVILMGWWMDPGLAATLFRARVRGYLLLEWLCFITVRSETIASIKNNKNFMLTGLGVAVMGIWGRLKGGRGCTVQGGE